MNHPTEHTDGYSSRCPSCPNDVFAWVGPFALEHSADGTTARYRCGWCDAEWSENWGTQIPELRSLIFKMVYGGPDSRPEDS